MTFESWIYSVESLSLLEGWGTRGVPQVEVGFVVLLFVGGVTMTDLRLIVVS